jgi:predicted RNA binding protein YcfA (HicA-like mRNA interferase family)
LQTRLVPVSWHELTRRLRKLGWEGPYPGKKLPYMFKDGVFLLIPNPHQGDDVSVDLIRKILNRAGISREEWFEAA